jgi:uncharacterized protein (TIGR03083 family)
VEFPELLRLIDERSTAFRAAVAATPRLDAPVPTCPGWTLSDLALHLGAGQRRWGAIVAAGPSDTRPDVPAAEGPAERSALLAWCAESTQVLLGALREAGPERGCWTWWAGAETPQTAGGVARHQLQEVSVHTYDAQLAGGAARPLPAEIALDGVEEFQATCVATPVAWPHEPAVIDYHAAEGRSWRVWLSADGARSARVTGDQDPADASAHGTASELVLFCYGRLSMDEVKMSGDRRHFERLIAWDPDE